MDFIRFLRVGGFVVQFGSVVTKAVQVAQRTPSPTPAMGTAEIVFVHAYWTKSTIDSGVPAPADVEFRATV